MLEPCIGGLYVHIFKTRHINYIKKNTEIPKWIQRTLWKYGAFQYLSSKSLSPCAYLIRCFLASREMLGLGVSQHLQFNSLNCTTQACSWFSPAPMDLALLADNGSEATQTPLWSFAYIKWINTYLKRFIL